MSRKKQMDDWADFRAALNTDIQRKVMQQKVILWSIITLLAISNAFTASLAYFAVSRSECVVRRLEAAENTIACLAVAGRNTPNNKKKR